MSSTADPSPGVAADAPDLTEAENAVRGWPFAGPSLVRVMAEYDQRGADLAEVHDALTMRSRLLAEEQAARSDVEQRLVVAEAALVQVRAQMIAEKREHVRTIDDALKVRDAWTAQHAAILALHPMHDAICPACSDRGRTGYMEPWPCPTVLALGVEKTDG